MLVVIGLGGNAILGRGEAPSAEVQQKHVASAVESFATLADDHDLAITHGNARQVGHLAIESAGDAALPQGDPFDTLGSETQGMLGYWLLQALENALPGREIASLICQTLVDNDDKAFRHPTTFVGPTYSRSQAEQLARLKGWHVAPDGAGWRRAVASPEPKAILELPIIRKLVADCAIVVCAGGGGIPVCRSADSRLRGAEAVVDEDLTAALLARDLGADALLLLTDVDGVEIGFGTPSARTIRHCSVADLRAKTVPAGSMGPKVDAACRFAEATGKPSMIGKLDDAVEVLNGSKGTLVEPDDHPATPIQRLPHRATSKHPSNQMRTARHLRSGHGR